MVTPKVQFNTEGNMKYLITTLRVLPFVMLAGLVQSTGLQGADAPKGAKEAPKKQAVV
jgi:hypothetical protein